jgi:AcrR family transcriptional regulator
MPREITFTRDMIVEAATELVASEGAGALSARNVAARLSASTAPIYSSIGSIDELRAAVVTRAREELRRYTRRPWSDRPFLNEGTGLVAFARDRPQLFALLFLTPEIASESVPKVYADLLADMKRDARFSRFTARERDSVLEKLWFMALGMATLAYSCQLRGATTEAILGSLMQAGAVLIPDAIARLEKHQT